MPQQPICEDPDSPPQKGMCYETHVCARDQREDVSESLYVLSSQNFNSF